MPRIRPAPGASPGQLCNKSPSPPSLCEPALWSTGTFWSAYNDNRNQAVSDVIEGDPVAAAVRTLMSTRTVWTGTASDLLGALAGAAGKLVAKRETWPDSPRALASRLRRAAAFLRKIDIEITFDRTGHERTRMIRITTIQALSQKRTAGQVRPHSPHRPRPLRTIPARPTASLLGTVRRPVLFKDLMRTVRTQFAPSSG
jgi:hypothetical protein